MRGRESPRGCRRTELPIPRELEEIVLSLLAKDPAARPQSAAELARRLAAVPIASPWTQERADRWLQTHLPHLLRETTIEAEDRGARDRVIHPP